jgi:hypothetical protein
MKFNKTILKKLTLSGNLSKTEILTYTMGGVDFVNLTCTTLVDQSKIVHSKSHIIKTYKNWCLIQQNYVVKKETLQIINEIVK